MKRKNLKHLKKKNLYHKMYDDIQVGDSISMTPDEEESKPKTPQAEESVSQTVDDIQVGDSINMSSEKEESKPKTPQEEESVSQTDIFN